MTPGSTDTPQGSAAHAAPRAVVVDTNIVLDLLVFRDPGTAGLQRAVDAGAARWLASAAMRAEFLRVLGYPQVARRLGAAGLEAAQVLARYEHLSHRVSEAPRAGARCSDADDQVFIDLAVAHGAVLLSKDRAVLALRKRLVALGVQVQTAWPA